MNKSEMWRSQGMEEHMTKEKVSAWSWMIRMSPEVGFVHRGAIEDFYLFFFLENIGRSILRKVTLEEMLFLRGGIFIEQNAFF